MVITALSEDTVRLLGSPTIIATPVDLVKELLDNAIDAKATSVETLVAPNLVDKIEVRDNGHGIHEEDHDSLGRPGHTSKIASFDELHNLGGTTLGFRGQALASANSLGTVSVTTRTQEDPTAVLLKLRAGVGGMDSKHRVSAPVGTTVSVTGLYSNMPVRLRTAIKEAPKNISRIKQLLQEYAFARPGVRLSLKSFGGSGKWSYSPRPQATVREAVIQLFGTELMSQCMIRTTCSGQSEMETDPTKDNEQMSIQAVLPSADGDLSKISKGAFFAVDSRPLTTANRTMKKLLIIFKSHLNRALNGMGRPDCQGDTFICVNIKCSPGSYDPNIEPSKNQVLFASESRLTDLFERLCVEVYGTQQNPDAFVTLEKRRLLYGTQTQTPPLSSDGPEERARPDLQATSLELHQEPHSHDFAGALFRGVNACRTFQRERLYKYYPGNPEQSPTLPSGSSSLQSSHTDTTQVRPDVSPLLEHGYPKDGALMETENTGADLPNFGSRAEHISTAAAAHFPHCHGFLDNIPGVDTSGDPGISSDEEAEVLASRFRGQPDARMEVRNFESPTELSIPRTMDRNTARIQQISGDRAASGGDVLDTTHLHALPVDGAPEESCEDLPILRPYGSLIGDLHPAQIMHIDTTHTAHEPQLPTFTPASIFHHNPDTNPAFAIMQETPQQAQSNGRHALPSLRSDYKNIEGNIGRDGLVQTTISFAGPDLSRKLTPQRAQLHVDDVLSRPNPPYRKPQMGNSGKRGPEASRNSRNARDNARDNARSKTGSPQAVTMEYNEVEYLGREHAARPGLHALRRLRDRPLESSTTSLSSPTGPDENCFETDSRKYLMRRQRSEADHRRRGHQLLKRAKSDMLPLEKIPDAYEIQRLVLIVVPDMNKLGDAQKHPSEDTIFGDGYRTGAKLGEELSLEDAAELDTKLRRVLDGWTEMNLGQRADVEINIGALVKGKTIAA